MVLTTGCTKTLTNDKNQAVKNEVTQQTLTENILCQPTDKATIKAYEENGVKLYLYSSLTIVLSNPSEKNIK